MTHNRPPSPNVPSSAQALIANTAEKQEASAAAAVAMYSHPIPRVDDGYVEVTPRAPEAILINMRSNESQHLRRSRSSALDKEEDDTLSQTYTRQLPILPMEIQNVGSRMESSESRNLPMNTHRASLGPQSAVDWIVPRDGSFQRPPREKTVGERLDPTLLTAQNEKEKYAFKARLTGYALNAAIGMQVVLGALTTGLSVVTTGHQTQIMTAILGGFATIVASYLARARGSNEPELSITRVKDLEQFIRECEAFKLDHGHVLGDKHDEDLHRFRDRFEELLGNANGERRLSPPV